MAQITSGYWLKALALALLLLVGIPSCVAWVSAAEPERLDTSYVFIAYNCEGKMIGVMVASPNHAYVFYAKHLTEPKAQQIVTRHIENAAETDTIFRHTINPKGEQCPRT